MVMYYSCDLKLYVFIIILDWIMYYYYVYIKYT